MSEPSPSVPTTAPTASTIAEAGTGSARAPRVFISYAHESDKHAEAVRDLWVFLRANGVDARLDRVAAQQRHDWTLWMEEHVDAADHIPVIASPAYQRRAGPGAEPGEERGVQYEARLLVTPQTRPAPRPIRVRRKSLPVQVRIAQNSR